MSGNTGPSVTPAENKISVVGWALIFAAIVFGSLLAWWFLANPRPAENASKKSENTKSEKPGLIREEFNAPAVVVRPVEREAVKPGLGAGGTQQAAQRRPEPSRMVAYAAKPPPPPPAPAQPSPMPASAAPGGPEKPETLAGMTVLQAEVISDASWYLMPGDMIQCVNEQPLTERSGAMWTARITEEVRGQGGTRILIPRYSRAHGRILKGFEFGERRLAAVLTHIQGPDVPGRPTLIIPLGMGQVGDALGRIDLEGNIETHFWSRLGTVAMYAGLDAFARVGTGLAAGHLNRSLNSGAGNDGVNVNVGNFNGMGTGRGLAGTALDKELSRQPNFDRPQSFPCSIMVTQPIDFRKSLQIGK